MGAWDSPADGVDPLELLRILIDRLHRVGGQGVQLPQVAVFGSANLMTMGPISIRAPSASLCTPVMGEPSTSTPFFDPRSWTVTPSQRRMNAACSRDTCSLCKSRSHPSERPAR